MPGRTQFPPEREDDFNQHDFLLNHSISGNGFLPEREPLRRLPNPYYAPWENSLDDLPSLIKGGTIRQSISRMEVLSTSKLHTQEEWRRAYVALSFLAHAYIWGGEKPSEVLPQAISAPFLRVSSYLGLPPVATYAALNLWNFACSGTDFRDLDKLQALHTFSGTPDESWFFVVSVAMEAQGAYIIPVMLQALGAAQERDYTTIIRALEELSVCIGKLGRLLDRMDEKCDPMVFYHQIRPYLAGSKNMGAAGLPNGVLYQDGDGALSWKQLRGGSNGQSSLIQFFDAVLGVEHRSSGNDTYAKSSVSPEAREPTQAFHEEVRSYMPGPHKKFLEHVSSMARLKDLANEPSDSDEQRQLRLSFQDATKALGDFRNKHMQLVARYIIVPSRKQSQVPATNLAAVRSERELTGTGGTALIPFLKQTRDETYMAGIKTSRGRLHLPSPGSITPQSPQTSVPSSAGQDPFPRPVVPSPPSPPSPLVQISRLSDDGNADNNITQHGDTSAGEEADVPREARLLCDARGKLTFVGDCAPLSLYQTIRQIVASRVDPNAFTPRTSRVSMLENASSDPLLPGNNEEPRVDPADVQQLVSVFISVTSGLVDLFERAHLTGNISAWASAQRERPRDATDAVNYLVLAIGYQSVDEKSAAHFFQYARTLALSCLGGDLGTETVQAFALVTLYMLRACQINGAFLFFGIAARAAYSIGLHRTEVNSRFGPELHIRRDRLWKSLRVLDLFLSISMGRPPSMSDTDCTVPCGDLDAGGQEKFDLLNATVQILSVMEDIVLQVYSRRKISLQLAEGISRQLRDWSRKWLSRLKQALDEMSEDMPNAIGACQVMSCYHYAVMLVARPFLMYELCKRLPENIDTDGYQVSSSDNSGRTRLANACIDAASLMAESVLSLVNRQLLDGRMPLIVSWLFASSLVLGVGLLGGFGRILEKYSCMSIAALEYFAKNDTHAMQYALIAKSLLSSALEYLQNKDIDERVQIMESSSQLFGLIPKESLHQGRAPASNTARSTAASNPQNTSVPQDLSTRDSPTSPFQDIDPILLSLECSLDVNSGTSFSNKDQQDQADQVFGALNLFPLLDGNGHIDLAHYF
ncbi:IDO-domain-containing protein [Rostrohypoxylon terebratum]|nr:IDO-domain-containing protein [Rostrohypoxylon terebratum]